MSIPSPYDLSKDEIVYLIDQFVFNHRDRLMIYERLLDGHTYEFIAEKHSLSVSQTKTIIHRTKEIVFSHIDRLPKTDRKSY